MFDVVIFFGVFFWIEPSNASFQSWRCFLTRYSPLKILVFFEAWFFFSGGNFEDIPKFIFGKISWKIVRKLITCFWAVLKVNFQKRWATFLRGCLFENAKTYFSPSIDHPPSLGMRAFWECAHFENARILGIFNKSGNFEAKFSKKRHFWGVEDFWKWKNAFLTIFKANYKKKDIFWGVGAFWKWKYLFHYF